ncbi:hydrogenase maturation protease [Phormidium pseudopriestleyi FRX01]|uniref:Hydrogenase maturation protease n=1 Tax=Phormidium pseudopriestleyi FRX01 TaxID=1759528 RepID=A0ABS3FPW6_9CYAN|nr:hydrogenase maturation protease [Phormidium pseudopriestleyi]MBO0349115.1 hydrogenase maturation protease [Phormidium pseudopriestleyi FRX01]
MLLIQQESTVVLAIGYGNDLRRDDGVGQRVADAVASWGLPQVRSLSEHQLTPELAEPLSQVDLAIFIDAYPATEEQGLQVVKLDGDDSMSPQSLGHSSDPSSLLILAKTLYGKAPQAWLVAIPGMDFEFGDTFSSVTERGMAEALVAIAQLIETAVRDGG